MQTHPAVTDVHNVMETTTYADAETRLARAERAAERRECHICPVIVRQLVCAGSLRPAGRLGVCVAVLAPAGLAGTVFALTEQGEGPTMNP